MLLRCFESNVAYCDKERKKRKDPDTKKPKVAEGFGSGESVYKKQKFIRKWLIALWGLQCFTGLECMWSTRTNVRWILVVCPFWRHVKWGLITSSKIGKFCLKLRSSHPILESILFVKRVSNGISTVIVIAFDEIIMQYLVFIWSNNSSLFFFFFTISNSC